VNLGSERATIALPGGPWRLELPSGEGVDASADRLALPPMRAALLLGTT
jgi:hypothetical protein